MVDTSTTSKVWPGQSFSSSDMTKRVWINANSDFLEPTRWLFNVSSGISSERINPVHLSLSLTVLDLLRAKQICKRKKLNIKMKKQQARWQSRLPALSLARSFCFHCNLGDYIIIEQMSIKSDFSFFNISVRIGTLLGVLGMCTHVCGSDVMWCRLQDVE